MTLLRGGSKERQGSRGEPVLLGATSSGLSAKVLEPVDAIEVGQLSWGPWNGVHIVFPTSHIQLSETACGLEGKDR